MLFYLSTLLRFSKDISDPDISRILRNSMIIVFPDYLAALLKVYFGIEAWRYNLEVAHLEKYYRIAIMYVFYTTYFRFLILFICGFQWQLFLYYLLEFLCTYFVMLRASRILIDRHRNTSEVIGKGIQEIMGLSQESQKIKVHPNFFKESVDHKFSLNKLKTDDPI